MAKITLLGTGAALADARRENMYMVVEGEKSAILIDCAGSPIQRLLKARVPLDRIEHVILTHHHPDHMYGLPMLLMDLWLDGRKQVLHIHGISETLRAARTVLHGFDWEEWKKRYFFPVEFHRIPARKNGISLVLVNHEFSISATPTKHFVPTIALRIVSNASGKVVTYSSDTEVCESVVEIARGSDCLIHEATTVDDTSLGHSSALQAGAQAERAGVNKLVLVHLPPDVDPKKSRAAAMKTFKGQVIVGQDFGTIRF